LDATTIPALASYGIQVLGSLSRVVYAVMKKDCNMHIHTMIHFLSLIATL
jgi:hypothetical protein